MSILGVYCKGIPSFGELSLLVLVLGALAIFTSSRGQHPSEVAVADRLMWPLCPEL